MYVKTLTPGTIKVLKKPKLFVTVPHFHITKPQTDYILPSPLNSNPKMLQPTTTNYTTI